MEVIVAQNQAVVLKDNDARPTLRKEPSGDFEYELKWTVSCEPNVRANYLTVMSENQAQEIKNVAGDLEVSLVITTSPLSKQKAFVNVFFDDEEGIVDLLLDIADKTPSKMIISIHYLNQTRTFDGRCDSIGCWFFRGSRLNLFEVMEIMNQDPTDFKVSIRLDFSVGN